MKVLQSTPDLLKVPKSASNLSEVLFNFSGIFFKFWENLSEFLGNIGLKVFKLKQGMLSYRL